MNRRTFLVTGAMAAAGSAAGLRAAPPRPRPSRAQLAWQRDELALFFHFGVNTFTNREWGDGKEDPATFNPSQLDASQWAAAARAAGARAAILTAKHHDGFCLWPTKTTTHSVAKSPWRDGHGDVVREFVDACRAERLRPGLYLSPWDRNSPVYGDSPRYNDLYCDQLTELLTRYGPLAEVWFDGANGEGPNGKKQAYDWPRVWALVRKLQPEAIMFSDAGPDVRWCGNEKGSGGDPNWSTVDPRVVTYPGVSGPGVSAALQHGDPEGSAWRPAEADTSIRPGWFHHPAEDTRRTHGGPSRRSVFSVRRTERQAAAQRAANAARPAARDRCHPAYEVQGRAGGDLPGRCGRGPSGRLAPHGREDGDRGDRAGALRANRRRPHRREHRERPGDRETRRHGVRRWRVAGARTRNHSRLHPAASVRANHRPPRQGDNRGRCRTAGAGGDQGVPTPVGRGLQRPASLQRA